MKRQAREKREAGGPDIIQTGGHMDFLSISICYIQIQTILGYQLTQYDEFYRSLLALSDNIADCSGQTNRQSNSSRPFLQTAKPISFIHIHNETTHYISFRIRLRLYGIFIQVTVSSPFLALITTAILAVCTKTTAEKKKTIVANFDLFFTSFTIYTQNAPKFKRIQPRFPRVFPTVYNHIKPKHQSPHLPSVYRTAVRVTCGVETLVPQKTSFAFRASSSHHHSHLHYPLPPPALQEQQPDRI